MRLVHLFRFLRPTFVWSTRFGFGCALEAFASDPRGVDLQLWRWISAAELHPRKYLGFAQDAGRQPKTAVWRLIWRHSLLAVYGSSGGSVLIAVETLLPLHSPERCGTT